MNKASLVPLNNVSSVAARENIMVIATVRPSAIEAMPLALIARAVLFGQNTASSPVYWAYYGFMKDIIAIMSNQVSPVTARLRYITQIIASWLPKTAKFKTGTLSYAWKGVDTINIPNVITVRGFKTFIFVPDGGTYGVWSTQGAPSNPSTTDDAYDKLSEVYTVLGDHQKKCIQFRTEPEPSEYAHDTSAFAACSLYYGGSNTPGIGASYSVENEVPFKSNILACTSLYDPTAGRVARNFNLASGDSTAAFGLPFLPSFKQEFFKTAYPVQYKFIDLDEVVSTLCYYYIGLIGGAINSGAGRPTQQTAFAFAPFTCSAQQFRIAIRQAILSYMSASGAMTQFINYATDNDGFEPFRCGTNSTPVNIPEIRLPNVLIENLRMLLPSYAFLSTKYPNPKNVVMMVPVWGVYRSALGNAPNPVGTFFQEYQDAYQQVNSNLFTGGGPDPSIIDGTGASGECVDLNSPIINSIIQEWNTRVLVLSSASITTGFLTGTSPTTILTLNRYCEYKEFNVPLASIPPYLKYGLNMDHIKKVKRASITRDRKLLTTGADEYDEYYVPPNFSLATQVSRAVGSMQIINEQLKTLIQYFILPSVAITPGEAPDQRAVRVQNFESEVWDLSSASQDFASSREVQLRAYATLMCPGIATAATSDELVSVVKHLNDTNQGGFLGNILTGVASVLLPMIPI